MFASRMLYVVTYITRNALYQVIEKSMFSERAYDDSSVGIDALIKT